MLETVITEKLSEMLQRLSRRFCTNVKDFKISILYNNGIEIKLLQNVDIISKISLSEALNYKGFDKALKEPIIRSKLLGLFSQYSKECNTQREKIDFRIYATDNKYNPKADLYFNNKLVKEVDLSKLI